MRFGCRGWCYTFEHAPRRVCGCARAGLGGACRVTAAAGGRAWRLPAADVLRLGARYREAAADLAYARRRFGDDPVTRRLETLVLRARPLVYGAPARRGSLVAYLAHGYWRAIAERPKPLIAAWLLLLLPAILAGCGR